MRTYSRNLNRPTFGWRVNPILRAIAQWLFCAVLLVALSVKW